MTVANKIALFSILGSMALLGVHPLFGIRANAQEAAASPAPETNVKFPVFDLPAPGADSDKTYLGLSGNESFQLAKIKAKTVIIEVFSYYCPHCQGAAPVVNKLYQLIQDNPSTRLNIRMIGLGAGNSSYEVNAFKEKYGVPFPLFPDSELEITRLLGVQFTPTFIGVNLAAPGGPERFYFKDGRFQDPQQFLSEIVKRSGLQ